jgi:hypothetical protein
MPVGFNGACDTGYCDAPPSMGGMGMGGMGMGGGMMGGMDRMVCGTCGGGGGCSCNSILGSGGVLGKIRNGGGMGCLFCRGAGCTACKELPFGYCGSVLAGCLSCLAPYSEASLCNQRWYDFSLEALFLDRNIGGPAPSVITTQGVAGTPVLSLGDLSGDEAQTGVRASVAMIWGVGGNVEATYMGGHDWSDTAVVNSATPTLFSYISDFGTLPGGVVSPGYDDTDRSLQQSIQSDAEFDSAEINYRRRTMFPYCRFQSSWLVGLRYVRYEDSLLYQTTGLNNDTVNGNLPRFYSNQNVSKNHLFGPQVGFDFWWNIYPGISLGFGAKGAWMQNDLDRRSLVTANSVPIGNSFVRRTVVAEDGDQQGALMGDMELKFVYRFSHSCSFRSSLYGMAIDNVAFGGLDPNIQYPSLNSPLILPAVQYESLSLAGGTVGIEYMW